MISSEHSAGWEDFLAHLRENPYGFSFSVTLFPAFVQGEEAESSILEALQDILMEVSRFDVVVLLRGGGSRVDLSCFDSYPLGKMITGFPLPVLTGIGHYRDRSVVDYVAHCALKTPTAVANFLVDRVKEFDEQLVEQYILLRNLIQEVFEGCGVTLEDWIGRFHNCATFLFQREKEKNSSC